MSTRPSKLTASAFELLIRAYWSPTALEDWQNVGNQTQESELIAHGLMYPEGKREECRLTPRGTAFVEFILDLPLPEAVWAVPGFQKMQPWP
jgi:hypothetical protein